MKKLLALVIIASISGVSGAELGLVGPEEVMEYESFTLMVTGLQEDVPLLGGIDGAVDGPIKVESAEFTSNVPGEGILEGSSLYWNDNYLDFTISGEGVQTGEWIIITYMAGAAGDQYQFDLLGPDFETVLDSLAVNVIPEPTTLGLLGLGVLFLRRRK